MSAIDRDKCTPEEWQAAERVMRTLAGRYLRQLVQQYFDQIIAGEVSEHLLGLVIEDDDGGDAFVATEPEMQKLLDEVPDDDLWRETFVEAAASTMRLTAPESCLRLLVVGEFGAMVTMLDMSQHFSAYSQGSS